MRKRKGFTLVELLVRSSSLNIWSLGMIEAGLPEHRSTTLLTIYGP